MIGRLSGIVIEKNPPEILLDVNGVGYELNAPMTTFYHLCESDAKVTLYTHFAVSENSQQLFGFISRRDRDLFRLLIKVNGVGPKMAVGIMCMESGDFVRCVMQDNVAALVKVPGVGKKTAERLIIEMRDRLKNWMVPGDTEIDAPLAPDSRGENGNTHILEEAESALVGLGYKPTEASRALAKIPSDRYERSEDLIRAALKAMVSG